MIAVRGTRQCVCTVCGDINVLGETTLSDSTVQFGRFTRDATLFADRVDLGEKGKALSARAPTGIRRIAVVPLQCHIQRHRPDDGAEIHISAVEQRVDHENVSTTKAPATLTFRISVV